jgi:hypothetical protein
MSFISVFINGMFITTELEQHRIVTVENAKGDIIAFMNLIPDFCARRDSLRPIQKTGQAPEGLT